MFGIEKCPLIRDNSAVSALEVLLKICLLSIITALKNHFCHVKVNNINIYLKSSYKEIVCEGYFFFSMRYQKWFIKFLSFIYFFAQ